MIGLIIIIGRIKGCFDLQCRSSPIPRGGGTRTDVSQPKRGTRSSRHVKRDDQGDGTPNRWCVCYMAAVCQPHHHRDVVEGEGWNATSGWGSGPKLSAQKTEPPALGARVLE
jgi:hypothetical protein